MYSFVNDDSTVCLTANLNWIILPAIVLQKSADDAPLKKLFLLIEIIELFSICSFVISDVGEFGT